MLRNAKHNEFVNQYFLLGFNQTRAYMQTYGETDENAAAANASRLIRNDKVAQEIKRRFEARAMKADEVIDRLSQIARGDLGDFLDITEMGYSVDVSKALKARKTHLIKKLKQKTTLVMGKGDAPDQEFHETEIELYSAHEALRDMGKVHVLFTDKIKVEGWRGEVINLLRSGVITPQDVLNEVESELALELFRAAGVEVS